MLTVIWAKLSSSVASCLLYEEWDPTTRKNCTCVLIEVLILRCQMDVQEKFCLSSSMINHGNLIPQDKMLVGPSMLCYSRFLYSTFLAGVLVFLNSFLSQAFQLYYSVPTLLYHSYTRYVIYNTRMDAGR